MKFLSKAKDGGPQSKVTGYWLVEIKGLFSVVLLCFDQGSREAFHSHAFNALSWVLRGELKEVVLASPGSQTYRASLWPILTKRACTHKVYGMAPTTWVLSFRGPWRDTWVEYAAGERRTLTHGRKVVGWSNLADVINAGGDAHTELGAVLAGISIEEAYARRKGERGPELKKEFDSVHRQAAKIVNFGFWGGVGA